MDPKACERLKAARKRAGLTQSDMAAVLGVSTSSYSGYERGLRDPSFAQLSIISERLRLPMSSLLYSPKGAQGTTTSPGPEQQASPEFRISRMLSDPWPRGVEAIAEIVSAMRRADAEMMYVLIATYANANDTVIPDSAKLTDEDFLTIPAPLFKEAPPRRIPEGDEEK